MAKKQPPKGPGGTPADARKPNDEKKMKSKVNGSAPVSVDSQRQYVVTTVFALLRNAGHQSLVAGAMLCAIGATVEETHSAAKAFGDMEV